MHFSKKHFWPIVFIFMIIGVLIASVGIKARAAEVATTDTTNTPTPFAPGNIVISEFRTRGPQGNNDEFIELYNPTGAAINISGWMIKRSSDCGPAVTASVVSIASNTILNAGQHYLLVSSNSSSITGADQAFTPALTDSGGLALTDSSGNVIDAAGMCNTTQYREGTNLDPLSGDIDQSYERKPGGATACYDTGSNAGDFVLISPSNPQNKATAIALCAGVSTSTPTRTLTRTFTSTLTLTRTPTRTNTTIPGFVVINEFLPHPHSDWNQDGEINVGDEYIELMNLSATPINVTNWKIDNGANTHAFILPNITLQPRQIVVYFRYETNVPLSDGGGVVRLVKADGRTADYFAYPPVEQMDRTWCRLFSETGLLTFECTPTPGRPNIVSNPTPMATPTGSAPNETPECSLPDTLPPSFFLGECSSPGGGIWQAPSLNPIYLQDHNKWPTFIE